MTLIAFIAFRRAECEVAVLEVGMGGRLDATNVVRPIAAVITPIGFDHMEYLGDTLGKIAAEKAGVIHRGAIALTSNDDARIVDVLRRRAAHVGAPLEIVTGEHDTPLSGPFQRRNAALAVRTAEALSSVLPRITAQSIERGVVTTRWRGTPRVHPRSAANRSGSTAATTATPSPSSLHSSSKACQGRALSSSASWRTKTSRPSAALSSRSSIG